MIKSATCQCGKPLVKDRAEILKLLKDAAWEVYQIKNEAIYSATISTVELALIHYWEKVDLVGKTDATKEYQTTVAMAWNKFYAQDAIIAGEVDAIEALT